MLNAFSPLSSPSILPIPLANNEPLPVPPPEGCLLLAPISQAEDAPNDKNPSSDKDDPCSTLWKVYKL